jgi:hypothetical protein
MANPWDPPLAQVAGYVPWLTIDVTRPADQVYLNTFTVNTSPPNIVAEQHIADAGTLILGRIPTMPTALYEQAAVAAARMAAATLAVAYARDEDQVRRAAALTVLAASALADLITDADNAGADSLSPLPVLFAPDPVPWGDSLLVDASATAYRQSYWPE